MAEALAIKDGAFAFDGNGPDAALPRLRAALDQAAPDEPIERLGDDGPHGLQRPPFA